MEEKKSAGIKAADYIEDGMIVGLGTGTTAYYLIERVGYLVHQGLSIRAVATSEATAKLAVQLKIPLISIDDVDHIDLDIDGVDEIDGTFNATKGGGGALFREKVVANLAREVIWIMDSSKRVDAIGAFPLPVEILPYGYRHVLDKLKSFGMNPVLRMYKDAPFITDNQNYIADLHLGKGFNPAGILKQLDSVTGVIETGLFLKICDRIVVGIDGGVRVLDNPNKVKSVP